MRVGKSDLLNGVRGKYRFGKLNFISLDGCKSIGDNTNDMVEELTIALLNNYL